MFSHGGFGAKVNRRGLAEKEAAIEELIALAQDNPDKALVMTYIGQLVAGGFAVWSKLENGEVEVRLSSGETYLLSQTTILRLA